MLTHWVKLAMPSFQEPIAKLSPIAKRRNVAPMKKYAGKVKIVGSMFDDTSADWEALR